LGLAKDPMFRDQFERSQWPAQSARLEQVFATRSRQEWSEIFEGSDACFAPVLSPSEAAAHPHNQARRAYIEEAGVLQGAPAPRFSDAPPWRPRPSPMRNEHAQEILAELEGLRP